RNADAIASAALRETESGKAKNAGMLAGLIEQSARLSGAEEVYIAVAPDLAADHRFNRTSQPTPLAERFAVRASVAYKGCWVRRIRLCGRVAGKGDVGSEGGSGSSERGKPIAAQLAAKLRDLPGATLTGWTAESCTGSYPLSAVASSHVPGKAATAAGQFLVL